MIKTNYSWAHVPALIYFNNHNNGDNNYINCFSSTCIINTHRNLMSTNLRDYFLNTF